MANYVWPKFGTATVIGKRHDRVDGVAKAIGAVNTVINKNGRLFGYNTDYVGIAKTLEKNSLEYKNVLVLGAGGAAQAVGYYLNTRQANIFCLNRKL